MSDVDPTLAAITDTYTDWLATHGADSSRGVGWHDPQMQALRFDVLALVMEGTEPVTVADFGCGTGALFDRLAARTEPPPLGGYTGYDLVPAMVETARERHTDPRARFEVGSAVTEDHDTCSPRAAFTIRPGIDDDAWEAQLHEVIAGLWARARRGIAFNIMIRTPSRPSRTSTPATPRAGRSGARRTSPARAWPCAWARRSTTSPCSSDARRRRVTWLETASETFVARHDERDAEDAERVLAQLEYARPRLQRRLGVRGRRARGRAAPHQRAARRRPAVAAAPARPDRAGRPPLRRRPGDRRGAARARAARAGRSAPPTSRARSSC